MKDQLFENIFNRASNGIAIIGLDFHWVRVNQSLMDLLGYSDEELYKMTFMDITHKDDVDLDMYELGQLLDGHVENYQMEKRYFRKDGSLIWVLISVSMEVDDQGKPHYFITQIMDITARKENERQMSFISDIVRKQNEKLLDFAHIVTHDMRTHIGNLNTITEFIEEENIAVKHDPNFGMLKEALGQFENTLANLNKVRQMDFSTENNLKSLNLFTFISNALYNVNAIARHEHCKISNFVDKSVKSWPLKCIWTVS